MIDCTTDEVMAWIAACALAFGLAFSGEDCAQYTEGTDMYHGCMTDWADIDLGVQDEADTVTSQTREEVTR